MNSRAQVSVYVIVAIVLVLGIVLFFVFRGELTERGIPQELAPVFEYYQSCIEQETRLAVQLAGAQGGRVFIEDYVPGSEYAPFSSHLNFLGSPIQYWYHLSGNGLIKEKVPTVQDMENEIEEYVARGLKDCDFEYFYRQGYSITVSEADVSVDISSSKVNVEVLSDLAVAKGSDSARKSSHDAEIDSKLGKFHSLATEIYFEEKNTAFLENYAVDVLYNYAPVDGVEIQCAPKIWVTTEVIEEIRLALEENLKTVKLGGDYQLKDDSRKYFVTDKIVDESVNVMYSKNWPSKIEIYGDGASSDVMVAEPIGTQQGLGILGFCYVPYHYIYDVNFPVLIQIYDEGELFQFPVVVIIDNNLPRQATISQTSSPEESFDLCEYRNKEVTVNLYDANLNSVDANVSYSCFNQRCRLGETTNGQIVGYAPACVNGYLQVRAEGYADKSFLFSSNTERFADIILDKEYKLNVSLKVGGSVSDDYAIVSFVNEEGSSISTVLPDLSEITLPEGSYDVSVYVYGNSSLTLPASTKMECVDVPREGLLGLLGSTKEKCFDITVPETKIESALIGGGKTSTYLLESQLEKGGLIVSVDRLPTPNSIEQLAQNFELFETKIVRMDFYEI